MADGFFSCRDALESQKARRAEDAGLRAAAQRKQRHESYRVAHAIREAYEHRLAEPQNLDGSVTRKSGYRPPYPWQSS